MTEYIKLDNEWKEILSVYKKVNDEWVLQTNVNSCILSSNIIINKTNPTYTAPTSKSNLVYNGEAQELINAGSTNDGIIKYSLDNSTWSTSIPTGTNANSYNVYWKLEGDNNHNNVSSTLINVTIAKANITPYVTISNWTYGSTASNPLVSGNLGNGTVTYYYKLQSSSSWASTKPSDAGNYNIKVNIESTSNYNSGTATNTFIINKVTPTVIAPTAKVLTYNGSAQELINAGSTNYGTLKYRLSSIASNLPYDSEVEYLYGNENQYIDTGIIPDSTCGIRIRVKNGYTTSKSANRYIVGLRNNSNNTRWCIGIIDNPYKDTIPYYYGYGTDTYIRPSTPFDAYAKIATLSLNYLNDKKFKCESGAITGSINLPSLSFTPSYNIRLFGSAGVSAYYTSWKGYMYSATISRGSDIIMDLIPVRKNGVGYMYDKISGTLYGNNGTGTFSYGADVSTSSIPTYSTSIPTATYTGSYTVYYMVEGNSNVNSVVETSIQCSIG